MLCSIYKLFFYLDMMLVFYNYIIVDTLVFLFNFEYI